MDVQRALVDWFRENGREFPWRETDDLFEVLVAELMLQRTTTTHVTKIYEDFVAEFPTPEAVLAADRDELMAYLEPLGLQQQRYDALTSICRTLVDDYDGDVPRDPDELQSIDGIGEYIANATLCFGDGQRL
ncbi:MAG: A/G-specific adenine glycosylase, partial [Halobacterium sp.]